MRISWQPPSWNRRTVHRPFECDTSDLPMEFVDEKQQTCMDTHDSELNMIMRSTVNIPVWSTEQCD